MFHRTQILLDRAEAFEKTGQWQSAIDVCERLFRHSWEAGRADDLIEALIRLGLLYVAQNDRELASEYFELVVDISRLTGDYQRGARGLNGLGVLKQRSGDIDGAEHLFRAAKKLATNVRDERTIGDIELNLGIIANIRGELDAALMHYSEALESYDRISNQHRAIRVLNNLGMLHTDMHNYSEAAITLEQALSKCREIGDVEVEGIVLTNRTELLLALGDLEGARASCDEAYEISSKLQDGQLKADALKSYGVIYRSTGKPNLAEAHLHQAITLAAELDFPLIEADANRELALVLRALNRNREALQALNRAHSLFTVLQAKQEQADIDKRFEQLESDFLSLVAKWGDSIEAKDLYTRGHCQRVADYACEIASKVGITGRELVWFRMGAFLHDVGKTEVPEQILNKPGRLTEDERLIVERHTVVGDEMLSTIEFPWDIRPMVRSHHERWDGNGYPDRLKEEAIPFSARILHIADVFDALTTNRSYRDPLSADEAIELMRSDLGSFDPELFAIFCEIIPRLTANSPNSGEVGR
jgi:putative nucleotidyltransferase with HDIG domain